MARNRYDETWHRLLEWTKGQAPSERLSAQILIHEGFTSLDPSHPLGGRDGGKDATATKNGISFAMAVYFPRGAQSFSAISSKFESDLAGVTRAGTQGIAFVTNQELTLGQREQLRALAGETAVELFHLERITAVLDTPDMASVREQFLEIEADSSRIQQFGGLGGVAPGAGGGGGAAIGNNSSGGPGGPGGSIRFLDGGPGQAPGAGGGGATAVGDEAVGGGGGEGGEIVSGFLGPEQLAGVHHFQIQVGEGGKNGGPGEDSIVNLCAEDGTVLRQIKAKGGREGAPAYVPPLHRKPSQSDLDAGLRVSAVIAAEFIRRRDWLWTIVEGGWDWIQVGTSPFRCPLPLYIEIETGAISHGMNLELGLVVLRPDGFQISEQKEIITVGNGPINRSRFAATLELVGSQGGIWKVEIRAGSNVIAVFPIEVRLPGDNVG